MWLLAAKFCAPGWWSQPGTSQCSTTLARERLIPGGHGLSNCRHVAHGVDSPVHCWVQVPSSSHKQKHFLCFPSFILVTVVGQLGTFSGWPINFPNLCMLCEAPPPFPYPPQSPLFSRLDKPLCSRTSPLPPIWQAHVPAFLWSQPSQVPEGDRRAFSPIQLYCWPCFCSVQYFLMPTYYPGVGETPVVLC